MNNKKITLRTHYYQQFDADYSLDVPAEGYGGWKTAELPLSLEHTALVVMHAWDCGTREQFPGWFRAIEYIPRADAICGEVFPSLLKAVRNSTMALFHVVGSGSYYKEYPGYKRARNLAGSTPPAPEKIESDPVMDELRQFRTENSFVGTHNQEDIKRGFERVDFPAEARPLGDEGIAEDDRQLFALCRETGINHLIYVGFAINWCLLLSPGGMADMRRHGVLCSTIPQAVTAVENKETARGEWGKANALWRVALAFGFVYDLEDFLGALKESTISD